MPARAKDRARELVAWIVSIPAIRRSLRSLCDRGLVPERIARALALRGAVPIVLPWAPQFLMRSDPRNALVRVLYFCPRTSEEPETLSVFVQLVDRARVVVDVGANQGLFTLVAAARNPNVRVFAFEPTPSVHSMLIDNLALNDLLDRVTASSYVVSDRPGSVEFRIPESPYATVAAIESVSRSRSGTTIDLPTVRLDDLLGDEEVDVVKIDVEGAEAMVIRGARRLLARTRAAVILEVLEPYDYAGAEELLRDLDYVFFHLTPNGPIPSPALVPDPARVHRNYLCLPQGVDPPSRPAEAARAGHRATPDAG